DAVANECVAQRGEDSRGLDVGAFRHHEFDLAGEVEWAVVIAAGGIESPFDALAREAANWGAEQIDDGEPGACDWTGVFARQRSGCCARRCDQYRDDQSTSAECAEHAIDDA